MAGHEAPAERARAAGVLAAYLTELYAVAEFSRLEYAADLLRPFDFVPAVDQLLYAPQLASSSSYFGDVADRDPLRDDVRLFADPDAPSPRLIYNKLLDLLGAAAFPALTRRMLNEGQPLRRAAAETFGADLDWFWRQWLGPLPRVNYRLQAVRVVPAAGGGDHVEIDVRREGATLREPVEVTVQRPQRRAADAALGRRPARPRLHRRPAGAPEGRRDRPARAPGRKRRRLAAPVRRSPLRRPPPAALAVPVRGVRRAAQHLAADRQLLGRLSAEAAARPAARDPADRLPQRDDRHRRGRRLLLQLRRAGDAQPAHDVGVRRPQPVAPQPVVRDGGGRARAARLSRQRARRPAARHPGLPLRPLARGRPGRRASATR